MPVLGVPGGRGELQHIPDAPAQLCATHRGWRADYLFIFVLYHDIIFVDQYVLLIYYINSNHRSGISLSSRTITSIGIGTAFALVLALVCVLVLILVLVFVLLPVLAFV